jgi:hypothetical protein
VANSYTPGLKLRKPAQGDDYWDDDLNANVDIIEMALGRGGEISGVIGSALHVTDDGGLTARYGPGSCRVAGAYKSFASAGTVNLADNSLNFVYVDSSGTVQAATTLPSSSYCALALVETAGGAVVRIGDMRRRLIDFSHQHADDGTHTNVSLTGIQSLATEESAYGRSTLVSAYEDPENSVNNLIIKPDARSLINTLLPMNPTTTEYVASNLGSGYVPAKANAIWMNVMAAAAGGVSSVSLKLWPSDQDHAGADYLSASRMRVPENAGSGGLWHQLMVRLSPDGKFKLNWGTTDPNGFWLTAVLLGWVEAA